MSGGYAIEADRLTKMYRSAWSGREIKAVSDLSLRVPVGLKYGLLGPNGAGKTTFVKMLLSSVNPTRGRAQIFGRDSREAEARRPVGYLPENHRFPTYLTGRGMLDFYSALSGMPFNERNRRIPELLELVGLKDWGEVRIKKYSKGMLQRLGLAQAMMHRPRLLVLDEPTDGVDPVGRRDIRQILNSLTGDGVTIFINSHLLSEVEAFCDDVAILHKGSVVLDGKISSLTAGRGYQIAIVGLPQDAEAVIRGMGAAVTTGTDGLRLHVSSREAVNKVIDEARAAGGWIESVAATTTSLEDIFIQATGQQRAA